MTVVALVSFGTVLIGSGSAAIGASPPRKDPDFRAVRGTGRTQDAGHRKGSDPTPLGQEKSKVKILVNVDGGKHGIHRVLLVDGWYLAWVCAAAGRRILKGSWIGSVRFWIGSSWKKVLTTLWVATPSLSVGMDSSSVLIDDRLPITDSMGLGL